MDLTLGQIIEGTITDILDYGVFVKLEDEKKNTGLVHISEISNSYVKDIKQVLQINQKVKVKVISIGDNGKVSLSIKQVPGDNGTQNVGSSNYTRRYTDNKKSNSNVKEKKSDEFEDVISKFMKDSEDKLRYVKNHFESKGGKYSRH
jgi:Predicted RNA binding protein (contains ribosomal protein S1 domain)